MKWNRALLGAVAAMATLFAAPCGSEDVIDSRHIAIHSKRRGASDLEVALAPGKTVFVTYADLLTLPQEHFRVADDTNFTGPVEIEGVALSRLPKLLGAPANQAMVIAVCDDNYEAHYPAEYLHDHHPVLVLKVNGRDPAHWPLGSDGVPMGPYMVTHEHFQPSFHVFAHADEPQVPWGVIRLDLRDQTQVYAPILPRGQHANDPLVQQGYTIARQNCFRCHSLDGEGGKKSNRTWDVVARRAMADPQYFDEYVVSPKRLNPAAQMAANPGYDPPTLNALRAYFMTFTEVRR